MHTLSNSSTVMTKPMHFQNSSVFALFPKATPIPPHPHILNRSNSVQTELNQVERWDKYLPVLSFYSNSKWSAHSGLWPRTKIWRSHLKFITFLCPVPFYYLADSKFLQWDYIKTAVINNKHPFVEKKRQIGEWSRAGCPQWQMKSGLCGAGQHNKRIVL